VRSGVDEKRPLPLAVVARAGVGVFVPDDGQRGVYGALRGFCVPGEDVQFDHERDPSAGFRAQRR
jgi:hypothetical protein